MAGISASKLTLIYVFVWFLTSTLISITLEARLWPSALAYALGFLACARWPLKTHYFMSLSNAAVTLNFAIVWRPRATEPPSSQLRS